MTELFTLSRELGFTAAAPVNMSALTPLEEVRAMCEADRCGRYGRSWACPPGCGTLEHTRARIEMYSEGILVQSTAELADEFDYQGIMRLTEEHKRRFADFARQARLVYPDCLPLTAGTCMLCRTCTYPDRPCRYPNRRLSSMEAYGLFVSDVCTKSGLRYNYGPRTLTFTSCVLY